MTINNVVVANYQVRDMVPWRQNHGTLSVVRKLRSIEAAANPHYAIGHARDQFCKRFRYAFLLTRDNRSIFRTLHREMPLYVPVL